MNSIIINKQNKMKRYILIFGLLVISQFCFSQTKMISVDDAVQDIDSLQRYIEEIHPNAYASISEDEMSKKYKYLKKHLVDSVSSYELFNQLSYIASSYNDGHLSIIYPNQWYSENHLVIPFSIDIEEGRMIIVNIDTTLGIPKYSEIITINSIPSRQIIDTMLTLVSGEAYNFKIERIKSSLPKLLFSIYKMDNEYAVQYMCDSQIITKDVNGIPYNEYKRLSRKNSTNEPYSAEFLDKKSTCIIDFNDFSYLSMFKIFTDSIFEQINEKNIDNLIIDLRNNGGGNSELGDELFQYISQTPFTQYEKSEMKISQQLKSLWENYYFPQGIIDSSELNVVLSIPNDTIINPLDYFSAEGEEDLIQLREIANRFTSNVYLLISNYTFSSATDFAWCFKHYNMGTVIGEETGGWGLCYGDNVYAELPNSRIGINVSCQLFYNIGATKNSTHGVMPDYEIKSEDALKYALDIIEND